jgi:molybdopterin-guanine dinucleotide biosynthesis protein
MRKAKSDLDACFDIAIVRGYKDRADRLVPIVDRRK